jgi:hypothetical protein
VGWRYVECVWGGGDEARGKWEDERRDRGGVGLEALGGGGVLTNQGEWKSSWQSLYPTETMIKAEQATRRYGMHVSSVFRELKGTKADKALKEIPSVCSLGRTLRDTNEMV